MQLREDKIFIVYRHVNPITGEVFYIGIGKPGREKNSWQRSGRWKNYFKKYGYKPEILYKNMTWYEACEKEKELIKLHGRRDLNAGTLINMTDGGDGATGHKGYWNGKKRPQLSLINKDKSIKRKGRTGIKHTTESIEKMSKSQTGVTPWNKGVKGIKIKISDEERKRRSDYAKSRSFSHSEETRKKISASRIEMFKKIACKQAV